VKKRTEVGSTTAKGSFTNSGRVKSLWRESEHAERAKCRRRRNRLPAAAIFDAGLVVRRDSGKEERAMTDGMLLRTQQKGVEKIPIKTGEVQEKEKRCVTCRGGQGPKEVSRSHRRQNAGKLVRAVKKKGGRWPSEHDDAKAKKDLPICPETSPAPREHLSGPYSWGRGGNQAFALLSGFEDTEKNLDAEGKRCGLRCPNRKT